MGILNLLLVVAGFFLVIVIMFIVAVWLLNKAMDKFFENENEVSEDDEFEYWRY